MSLFTSSEEIVIPVVYSRNNGKLEIINDPDKKEDKDEKANTYISETFTFKRPAWGDMKSILSESVSVTPEGEWKVDPWKYMDAKIRRLLKDWSLKDDGKKVPITRANIDRLENELVNYLSAKIDERFGEATSLA